MIKLKRRMLTTAAIGVGAALTLAACEEREEVPDTAVVVPPPVDTTTTAPGYDTTTPGAAGTAAVPGATGTMATTPGATTAPGTTTTTPGATGAATGTAADTSAQVGQFTEQQLRQFAQASDRIHQASGAQTAQAPTTATDPSAAVRQAGLTPEEYMRIAAAALHDPALRQRIMQQQ